MDAEVEGASGVVGGFDHAVGGAGDDPKRAGVADGLVVMAGDVAGRDGRLRDGDDRVRMIVHVVGVGRRVVGEVLAKRPAGVQGHELEAEADAEDGHRAAIVERGEEGLFVTLTVGVERFGGGVGGFTVALGARVRTAGEDDGVAEVEVNAGDVAELGIVHRAGRRQEDRNAAGPDNGVNVGGADAANRFIERTGKTDDDGHGSMIGQSRL